MLHNWFETKVRYSKMGENGTEKMVTEPFLFDALSFTEAEARIIEEITPYISGEFTVSDIKRAKYSEIFFSEEDAADRWFKCKVAFITLDEKSGAEKKTSTNMLVQASDHIGSITTYVNTVEYCYAEMEGGLIVNRKDLEKAPGYSPKKLKELGNKRYTRKFINGVFIRGKTAAEVRSKIQNALNEVEDNI